MTDLKPGWKRVKFGEVVRQVKDKVDPETSGLKRFVPVQGSGLITTSIGPGEPLTAG